MDPILNVLSVTGGRRLPTCDLATIQTDRVILARRPDIFPDDRQLASRLYAVMDQELPPGIIVPEWITPVWAEDPEWSFVVYHNEVWKDFTPLEPQIGSGAYIDRSAILGADGIKIVQKRGSLLRMKHVGTVVIGQRCYIAQQVVIHRAKFSATILEEEVTVGAFGNIGHGAFIGYQTILAPGVLVGGSVQIGRHCFLAQGANIRDNVTIGNRIKIGMGAVVTKNLDEPGTYFGVPARRVGSWDGRW